MDEDGRNIKENKKQGKDIGDKFLGANRNQALILGLIMVLLHAFTTAYSIYSKISVDMFFKMTSNERNDLVEWYYFYPTLILAIWFFGHYIEKFNINFILRILIVVLSASILEEIFKVLFFAILYSL